MGWGLCKSCYSKWRYYGDGGRTKLKMLDYAHKHPAQRGAIWRKHAYGLSEQEWHALYRRQKGCCAICRKPEPINVLNVDHDHETNEVRGLLCGRCNKALGYLYDRTELLVRAQRYLERNDHMSRKADPIVGVLHFFETASVEAASMALALVRAVVKRRTTPKDPVIRRKRRVMKPLTSPATPTTPASPGLPDGKAPRRRMRAAPSQAEALKDLPLPGIGPSTVGD